MRGFSLLEVLTMMVVVAGVGMAVIQFLKFQQGLSANLTNKELMLEILQQQVLEVNVRPISELPSVNQCLVREFGKFGDMVSESGPFASDSSECTQGPPQDQSIRVRLFVESIDAAQFNFEPAQFLKLPERVDSLKQIRVVAVGQSGTAKTESHPIEVTFFKRAG